MKKAVRSILILLIALSMIISIACCGTRKVDTVKDEAQNTTTVNSVDESSTVNEESKSQEERPYVWKPDSDSLEWKNDTSPVTLTAFMNFPSSVPFEWGTNDVTKEITKRTGVTIEATYAPDGDSQKLSVMLASGDKLPDFIIGVQPPAPLYYSMLRDDLIWSLTDLMDQYAPKMREVMLKGNEEFCAEEDGKLYWLGMTMAGTDQTGDSRITPAPSFAVRNDVWEALGRPEIKTPEDLVSFARKVKDGKFEGIKYPVFFETISSVPSAPMFGAPGIDNGWIYNNTEGSVMFWTEHPKSKSGLKFVNQLVREGLMPEEAFTVADNNMEIEKGNIALLAVSNIFRTYSANANLMKEDPNKYYKYISPIVKEGEKYERFYNFRAFSWRGAIITKDSKKAERAIKYLEFMVSDEGQQLLLYGIDGVHHDMKKSEEGWYYPEFKPEISDLLSNDFGTLGTKYGIYSYMTHCWLIKEVYDYTLAYGSGLNKANALKREGEVEYSKYKVANRVEGLPSSVPNPSDSKISGIPSKLTDYTKQQFGKLLTAKTDEAFEEEYKALLEGYKTIGIDKMKDYYLEACKKMIDKAKETGIEFVYPK